PSDGWPAIFMIHGGPEAQMRPDFNPIIQFFLASGFALITPNIRGSEGYGRKYLDLDNIEKRLDSIKDIKSLAIHVKDQEKEIDGNRLVIYGGSYGGFAVLSAMTEHPEFWKAGIDIVGISNFVTFLQNTAAWRRTLREAEYGSLEHDMEILTRMSPIHKIDNIAAPLLIIQGDNDERVPLSESLQMYEKLKEKGLEVRLMRFADEGHGLAKLENRINAYTEVISWLKEIL
ncbi:MAG: prolyl oligopeptidase family serine peptidase, partial [Candidatus Thorarchaeota archaeon]|nr:prolyl oligopeptidase family serine peptidase [Candidatus Thorarchaeota archaeon]